MGIDAQRSGASELPVRAVEVRRAQGATTKAVPVWIVEEEQHRDRPHSGPCNLRQTDDGRARQDPCALRVAAAGGRLLRCGGSTMCTDIACAAAPCIRPPGARNAAPCTFTTDCYRRRAPPSTTSVCPVTKLERSEARKSTAPPTSSGSPQRPSADASAIA